MEMAPSPSSSSSSLDGSSALASTMPWEWTLEACLDVKELSLPFLLHLIDNIPHIEGPRCSRLLQKVALRFLADVVEMQSIHPCDVALIRFLVKAEGLDTDAHKIHSLKDEFTLDLILRIETEAVLSTLRGSDGGRTRRDAFEEAVCGVFVSDAEGSRGAERRKELLSIVPRRPGDELAKESCEDLLRKYSLEELLNDIAKFVEDRKKPFSLKFLDQLAKDVRSETYSPFSPLVSSSAANGMREAHSQGKEETLPASTPADISPKAAERVSDHADCDLNLEQGSATRPRMDAAGQEGAALAENGRDVSRDSRKDFQRAGGDGEGNDEDPVADLSVMFKELAELPAGMRKGVDEIVSRMTKFAGEARSKARMSTFASDGIFVVPPTPADSAAHTDLHHSETAPPRKDSGVEKNRDHHETTNQGTFRTAAKEWVDGGGAGEEAEPVDILDRQHSPVRARIASGRKRVSTDRTDGSKRTKFVGGMESGDPGLSRQGGSVHKDLLGSMSDQSRGGRESSFDAADRNVNLPEGSGSHRTRVFLSRATKDRTGNLRDVEAESDEESGEAVSRDGRQETFEDSRLAADDRYARRLSGQGENLPCDLDDDPSRQVFCHQCLAMMYECCAADPSMIRQSPSDSTRLCVPCASRIARENLKKDEEAASRTDDVVKMYEEALKRAEEDLSNARCGFERAKETALNSKQRVDFFEGDACRGQCKHRQSDNASPGLERPKSVGSPQSIRTSSHAAPPQDGAASLRSRSKSMDGQKRSTSAQGGRSSDKTAERLSPAPIDSRPLGAAQSNYVDLEVDGGDRHDGDLDEDPDKVTASADRSGGAEQTEDSGFTPSKTETRSRRGPVFRPRGQIPGVRRKHLPWTPEEEDTLRELVLRHSHEGKWGYHWKLVLQDGTGKFHESRTTVDLKDKWRNLSKKSGAAQ